MKAESFSPHIAVPALEAKSFELTYGEFLTMVRERKLAELEESHPGEDQRNNNNAGNMVRAMRAFMKANDLQDADPVGLEMRDETIWEAARDRLGPKAASYRSLVSKARLWALEAFRVNEAWSEGETFGECLARLRAASGLSYRELQSAASTSNKKADSAALYRWERGETYPHAKTSLLIVKRLEVVFGVPAGTLVSKLPKVRYKAPSSDLALPASLKRRIAPHLPHNFDSRSDDEQEEILSWVAENILSTPKEIYEDGRISEPSTQDVFSFALSRKAGSRLKMAPAHLIAELNELGDFKTRALPKRGMRRTILSGKKRKTKEAVWKKVSHEKADYSLRAFFGALDLMGLPPSAQSLSILLSPEAIDRFIEWRYERRGAYTNTLVKFLQLVAGFLHKEGGFLTQMESFGSSLREIPGFIDKNTVQLAKTDWKAACATSRSEIYNRIQQIQGVMEVGRDPFEAVRPAIDAPQPLFVYWKIVDEIRARIPGPEYPVRMAEVLRSMAIIRIALGSGLRSRNLRELLICPKGGTPKTEKELRRLKRGEMRWIDGMWWIAIPDVAFKNSDSSAVEVWNEFPLPDPDGKLDADISAYLSARDDLLAGHPDPGTLFVKTMNSRSEKSEFTQAGFYNVFRAIITNYGIYNPYTGRGALKGLRPHGPHSLRHVLGTHLIKNETVSDAAASLFDTEDTILEHYGSYSAEERHRDAMQKAWSGFDAEKSGESS